MKFKPSKLWYVVGTLLAANIALLAAIAQIRPAGFATVHFFDVGQGDAVYIRSGRGNDILIDGGPTGGNVLSKLGRAMPFADRTIELLVLTHPHADHVAGLIEVLHRFQVQKVILPEVEYKTATYQAFLEAVASEQAEVITPKLGQRLFLDEALVMDIFYPLTGSFASDPDDINDVSVVARLTLGQSNVLLMGDAGKGIEELLLKAGLPLRSEVVKVGHHGSRHSSRSDFISAVAADFGVIQVGKNSYGHPHPEILGVLTETNIQTLRTDEQGDIVFELYPERVVRK